ncbi:MAG: class I SAM-dependent methyltransferase [Planctomycetota bacterium]|nr:class I SAM-dependent methyltransferase [Planctomycetota bacterium]
MSRTSEHSAKVQSYFDHRVADYDAFYDQPSAFWRWFNRTMRKAVYYRRDQTVTLAQKYGCRSVLDVGCGSGQNSVWFVRHGLERVLGLDISSEMVEESRGLAERAGVASRCEFRYGDFMSMDFSGKCDIACALGVFDYVLEPDPFLRRMAQHAEKVIYGSFPGWSLVRSPLRKLRYALRGCPTHFYRQAQVRALFESVGFGSVHVMPIPSGFLAWSVRDEVEDESA